MYKKYLDEATKIYNGFNNRFTDEWLAKNGMTELYKMLLDDIADAKNDTERDRAKFQFKQRILMPFFKEYVANSDQEAVDAFYADNPTMAMEEPKGLGSYDELKKNPNLKQSKYAVKSVDKDGKEIVDVPLLRLVGDENELAAAAKFLNVSPEELRDHVLNEWDKKKKREWPEIEKKMKEEILKNRKGVLKDFNKSKWSGVLKTVAPELYAGMRRDIAEGKGEAGSVIGWLGQHKKDAALDASRNGMLAATGFVASPIATAGLVGGTELAALAGSDYYDMNARNVGAAMAGATFAGTVPSLVTRYASPLLRSGNKMIKNSAREILRRIRNGEGTPAEVERDNLKELVDNAASVVRSRVAGNETLTSDDVNKAVNAVYQKVISSPKMAFSDGTSIYKSDIEKALLTDEGVNTIKGFLSAPSKNTWIEWNKMSKHPNYGFEQREALQNAMKRTEDMFPEALKEIKYISGNGNALNSVIAVGAKGVNLVGSKTEPMAARNVYEEGLSSYEASNPEQVEYWKRYGIPDWDPLAEEFNEKYGEGR